MRVTDASYSVAAASAFSKVKMDLSWAYVISSVEAMAA